MKKEKRTKAKNRKKLKKKKWYKSRLQWNKRRKLKRWQFRFSIARRNLILPCMR
jgi:hypothetical protein